MTIAISGATGQLGRLVIESLRAKGAGGASVALARAPDRAADLGVEVRAFDYSVPASLPAALAGIDTLLLVSSNDIGRREAQHRHVIDAARTARVRHIVYTSLLHADTSPLVLAAEHLATEAMLGASGLGVTILRNGWYTENYTMAIPGALNAGSLFGSARDGRISSAARADFAEAAAIVLTDKAHQGRTYELAGDEAWTLAELAAEISRQTGHPLPFVNVPETEFAAILMRAGLPEAMARAVAGFDVAASKGALFDAGRALSALIGRPTTPLSGTVAAALATKGM